MIEVIPAILAEDYEELRSEVSRIADFTQTIQIDVCDGNFVPTLTWPLSELHGDKSAQFIERILEEEEGLPYWDKVDFEFDLMARNAHLDFEFYTRLGAKRIVFHIEAEGDMDEFKEFLEGLDMYTRDNINIGVAINTTTSTDILTSIISYIDFVQCMGIEYIGKQGEEFDERVLNQISTLRATYPELIISVDGSVNEKTAPALVKAGANRLVIGSAIIKSVNVNEKIKEFESLLNK